MPRKFMTQHRRAGNGIAIGAFVGTRDTVKRLDPVEMSMVDTIMTPIHDIRSMQAGGTSACQNFYKGCLCIGCCEAEKHNPASWPYLGVKDE
jgi:hypothetical protein